MNKKSFGSKLASFGKAAYEETKRNARLAGMKGRMEKLKHVDLNLAHYALGKKCYDENLFREEFRPKFDEIAKLGQTIAEKRRGTSAVEGQSTGETLRKAGREIAMQTKAEALSLKLKPLFVSLGRAVELLRTSYTQIEKEIAMVKAVRQSLSKDEEEYALLSRDGSHIKELRSQSSSFVSDAKTFFSNWTHDSASTTKKNGIIIGLAIIVISALIMSDRARKHVSRTVSETLHKTPTSSQTQQEPDPGPHKQQSRNPYNESVVQDLEAVLPSIAKCKNVGRRYPELVSLYKTGMNAQNLPQSQSSAEYAVGRIAAERQWEIESSILLAQKEGIVVDQRGGYPRSLKEDIALFIKDGMTPKSGDYYGAYELISKSTEVSAEQKQKLLQETEEMLSAYYFHAQHESDFSFVLALNIHRPFSLMVAAGYPPKDGPDKDDNFSQASLSGILRTMPVLLSNIASKEGLSLQSCDSLPVDLAGIWDAPFEGKSVITFTFRPDGLAVVYGSTRGTEVARIWRSGNRYFFALDRSHFALVIDCVQNSAVKRATIVFKAEIFPGLESKKWLKLINVATSITQQESTERPSGPPSYSSHIASGSLTDPTGATRESPFINSLGMKFVPVEITEGPTKGTRVLFSIWDTRVQDYAAFADAKGITPSKPLYEQGPTHPVVDVSMEDGRAFCAWLTEKDRSAGLLKGGAGYRLPTDDEWSSAVGPSKYPWGDTWPPPYGAGNYPSSLQVDEYENTSPVGSFMPNRYGLFDMGGNVSHSVIPSTKRL